jgi:mutator protein MutT
MEPVRRPPGRPQVGVSICVVRQGRVLLAQRAKEPLRGLWSLPGGRVEWGETLRQAALRELAEETSVEAEIKVLLDSVDVIQRDPSGNVLYHYVLTTFGALWVSGDGQAGGDASAIRWAAPAELDRLAMTPGTADLIRRAVPRISGQ